MKENILEIAQECGATTKDLIRVSPKEDRCYVLEQTTLFTDEELERFAIRIKQKALLEAADKCEMAGKLTHFEFEAGATLCANELRRMAEQLGKGE